MSQNLQKKIYLLIELLLFILLYFIEETGPVDSKLEVPRKRPLTAANVNMQLTRRLSSIYSTVTDLHMCAFAHV